MEIQSNFQDLRVTYRPLTPEDARALPRVRILKDARNWIVASLLMTSVLGLVAVPFLALRFIVWLLFDRRYASLDVLDGLKTAGLVLAITLPVTATYTGRDLLRVRRKQRRLRALELTRGSVRTTRAVARRAWSFGPVRPIGRTMIFDIGEGRLITVPIRPADTWPPAKTRRLIRIDQLPWSGDLIGFEFAGEELAVEALQPDVILVLGEEAAFWSADPEIVDVSDTSPELRSALGF